MRTKPLGHPLCQRIHKVAKSPARLLAVWWHEERPRLSAPNMPTAAAWLDRHFCLNGLVALIVSQMEVRHLKVINACLVAISDLQAR